MDQRQQFVAALRENPNDEALRFVFADWCEENNDLPTAHMLREGPVMPVVELTVEKLFGSSDWAEVFADENSGNVSKDTDPCPPGSDVDTTPPNRGDVVEIIAAVDGEPDESDWLGVFRLRDGRFLLAYGGCDYTGWD